MNDHPIIVGIDEVGRGCLSADVWAAAVAFLDSTIIPEGITDSKKLTSKKRQALAAQIRKVAIVGIGRVTASEIDKINILNATMLAMKRAFNDLPAGNYHVLVDGNRAPDLGVPTEVIIKGDETHTVIGAASIIAKVGRDKMMDRLHVEYPYYDWAHNKGYGTPKHLDGIRLHGPSPHHRMTFAPLRQTCLAL